MYKRIPLGPSQITRHKSFLDRLGMYALTATAAGIGMVATSDPADASVIYTPAHTQIVTGTVSLDLNNDGIADFNFTREVFYGGRAFSSSTVIAPLNPGNRVEGNGQIRFSGVPAVSAFALPAGSVVGPAQQPFFPAGQKFMRGYFYDIGTIQLNRSSAGAWANKNGLSDRYLGLVFTINGQTHFGWARLSVPARTHMFDVGTTLTGYAYETVPGKPITTGSPQEMATLPDGASQLHQQSVPVQIQDQTLGALALGHAGINIWRREEEMTAQPS
jgi:hypothetical protein